MEIYPAAYSGAKYNDNRHCWVFPGGAKIYFGSMQYRQDRVKYQGKRYDFVGFDELTHFEWEEYAYMFSRNRPGGPGTRCYIRATCNPGGIGHSWVKSRFIAGKQPLTTYWEEVCIGGKMYRRSRVFVPSTVFDNKILLENDPNYVAALGMLPEQERKALLYGDWDSFSGQVFTEFCNHPEGADTRQFTHVIRPFAIPKDWKRYRSFDFGYSRPFSVAWWAVDQDGRVYRYRELYGSTGEPNVGLKWHPKQIAAKIQEMEEKYEKGCHITGIADPSIWDQSRGSEGSIITMMENSGLYFEKANNARIAGKMQLHYRLAFDEEGYPMLYVFDTCKEFIRTIGALMYDPLDTEDVDSSGEDHIYDETRYFLMCDPIGPPKPRAKSNIPLFHPLDLNEITAG